VKRVFRAEDLHTRPRDPVVSIPVTGYLHPWHATWAHSIDNPEVTLGELPSQVGIPSGLLMMERILRCTTPRVEWVEIGKKHVLVCYVDRGSDYDNRQFGAILINNVVQVLKEFGIQYDSAKDPEYFPAYRVTP
jgi:hypothetical protein